MAERRERAKFLFESALERPEQERETYLREACSGDETLCAEVESLLRAYRESFLESPPQPACSDSTLADESESSYAEKQLGAYRLLRKIGHGGMGAVYLAVRADREFQKQVAIKVIPAGEHNEEVVRRFRSERQSLAVLDHPNIVKLLDGGTTPEGLPYLVMDYIDGLPIDVYCERQKLPLQKRLELFRAICSAVDYAHRNLIVHRDLKPSNILVTPDGIPKLLDFGIAKLLRPELSPETLGITQTDFHPMTPEYASPEQFRGEPITTASDVYSLGVLLFFLLTGRSPYRLKTRTLVEIEKAVCEQELEKPSDVLKQNDANSRSLARRVSGDLDNIVLMAMRKEPQRRYASVEQLSEDIRRHLEGEPVFARKPTAGYLCGKFVRRHKLGVAAAVIVICALGLLGLTSWQARVANAQRASAEALAERRAQDVRELARSYIFDFYDSIKNLQGSLSARKMVVETGLQYLDRLAKESASSPALQLELAEAYIRIGDVQGDPYFSSEGSTSSAFASYEKAQRLAEQVSNSALKDRARRALALASRKSGNILPALGQPQKAAENVRKAAEIYEELVTAEPQNAQAHIDAAIAYDGLGDVLGNGSFLNVGDTRSALDSYNKSLAHYQAAARLDTDNRKARRGVAIGYAKLGDMNLQVLGGQPSAALDMFEKSLAIFQKLAEEEPANSDFQQNVAIVNERIAQTLVEIGRFPEAVRHQETALAFYEKRAQERNDGLAQLSLAIGLRNMGDAQHKQGNIGGALTRYRRVISIMESLSSKEPNNIQWRSMLADILVTTGTETAKQGQNEAARPMTSRGLVLAKELANRTGATSDEVKAYAQCLLDCEPADLRNPSLAFNYAQKAVQLAGENNAELQDLLARAYFRTGNVANAIQAEEKALASLPAAGPGQAPSAARKEFESNLNVFKTALTRR